MSILYFYGLKRQNLAEYVSTAKKTEVKSSVISKCMGFRMYKMAIFRRFSPLSSVNKKKYFAYDPFQNVAQLLMLAYFSTPLSFI